ncbi:Na+/H+ antiporter NhaA [Sphingomonas sp. GCM10030256]|uniref:Na+/H+ antiporter NhaA n=1 Tax=Sphingomonas sp. GCM10030256 TaxID=3273427 RepID=UPI00362333AB
MSQADTERDEKIAGLALMAAAAAALLVANSPLAASYQGLLHLKLGPLDVHHWIADGLMALFFLLVGLEVKREWFAGRLVTPAQRRLPILAAAAGMAVPALIYLLVAGGEPGLSRGWAVPAATDIAFALGVLALLGSRAPASLKLLLVTIAIIDDIGAVVVIALFYTADLHPGPLAAAAAILALMGAMNLFGVRRLWPYLFGFAALWVAVHESGIHATIAGVLAALTVPLGKGEARSPLKVLEHRLHKPVMLGVVPLFGFASAGVAFSGLDAILSPLPLGIALGLFLGKQIGVVGAVHLAHRSGLAPKPDSVTWRQVHGAALLCGIGFTMSLFIGALAFGDPALVDQAKIGTLLGSLASGIAGFLVLRTAPPLPSSEADRSEALKIFGEDQGRTTA